MDTNNNIFFTVEDNLDNDATTKLTDIDKMMDELIKDDDTNDDFNYYDFDYEFDSEKTTSSQSLTLSYFDEKNLY